MQRGLDSGQGFVGVATGAGFPRRVETIVKSKWPGPACFLIRERRRRVQMILSWDEPCFLFQAFLGECGS